MKTYEQIQCEVSDHILTITLNRPEKLNAYTEFMRDELIDALNDAEQDGEIRAVIFTGAGRGYCAGMDLSDKGSTFDYSKVDPLEHRDGGGMLTLRLYNFNKPVIAAINGPAVGIGCTMTLPMDFRIASATAKMGVVFVRRGIITDACSNYFLPRICGVPNALDLMLTGRVVTAAEALELGLVSKVVEPERLLTEARALALDIAQNTAPVSVALVKRLVWRMQGASHPMSSHEIESRLFHWVGQQPDASEGINSFLEKRPPAFSMNPATDMPDFYPWWKEPAFRGR
jgi:enoyl-CoA hydratase/carnithine racemase